jgi:hypothetical protein
MPIAANLAIDLDSLGSVQRNLEEVAYSAGIAVRDVLADQMRLLLQDFMAKRIPLPESAPQGRKAIDRDLNKLFVSIDQQAVLNFFEDDFGSGELPGSVIFNFDGNESRMQGFWQKHRQKTGRKQGRVRYRGKIVATVGKWKFVNKMYVPRRAYNSFRRQLHKDVGTLKAGWVIAAQKAAAIVGRNVRIPAWVMKQARKMGRFQASGIRQIQDISISATNSVPYAAAKYQETGLMAVAMFRRQKDMFGGVNYRIQRLIDQFNTGKRLGAKQFGG